MEEINYFYGEKGGVDTIH